MSIHAAPVRSRSRGRAHAAAGGVPEGHTPVPAVRTRPTRRALVQLVLGVILYGAGSNVSAGWVVVLAALVLGTLPWAFITSRRTARTLSVRRVLPATVTAGLDTEVVLEVRARTTAVAVVEDELTGAVGIAGELGATAELAATSRLRRGRHVAGDVRVTLTDVFGLVTVVAEASVPSHAEVLPAIPRVRGLDVSQAWALEAGTDATRAGHGVEVMGVREYRRGDPLRSIHWRSSARRGDVVVRELADQARPRVRVEIAADTWTADLLDRACEIAGGVAEDASRTGLPVDVAVDGELLPWSLAARRVLAVAPPHAGATARPLRATPISPADVTVHLEPSAAGVLVSVDDATSHARLGAVPADAGLDDVEAWLELQLHRGRS